MFITFQDQDPLGQGQRNDRAPVRAEAQGPRLLRRQRQRLRDQEGLAQDQEDGQGGRRNVHLHG